MEVIEAYSEHGGGKQEPNKVVIHAMAEIVVIKKDLYLKKKDKTILAGKYSALEWLELLGLSAHFQLHPDGKFTKMRHTHDIAWHAKGFNINSVGIEVLVPGEWDYDGFIEQIKTDWVTPEQFDSLVEMTAGIMDYYRILSKDVFMHSRLSPNRKYDPGSGFKWEKFTLAVKQSRKLFG
jgi:N-acetyl-anhydromuramyl-L-alanine amidase AmpD